MKLKDETETENKDNETGNENGNYDSLLAYEPMPSQERQNDIPMLYKRLDRD